MYLHYCRCFQEHLRMLLQSLRVLWKAPGGAWKPLEVLRCTGEGYWSVWEVCIWFPDRFTFWWCCEDQFRVNSNQNFHSGESGFLIFHNLWEIRIITQELLYLDLKLSLTSPKQLEPIENWFTSPICQLSSNGNTLRFVPLYLLLCSEYHNPESGSLKRVQDWYRGVFADNYWEMDHETIDIQQVYIWQHLLMPAMILSLNGKSRCFLNHWVHQIGSYWPRSLCEHSHMGEHFLYIQSCHFVLGIIRISTCFPLWNILCSTTRGYREHLNR